MFRRNPLITALSCVPFALLGIFWLLYALGNSDLVILTPHLLAVGAVSFFAAWRRKPFAKLEDVRVSVDAKTLRIGDEPIRRAELTNAQLVPAMASKPLMVRVSRRLRPDLDIVVQSADEAHQLLRALGYDPSQTTETFRGGSLALARYRWAIFGAMLPMALVLGVFSAHIGRAVILPFVILAMWPMLWPSSLTVGADGLLLKWLWVREFISTKSIQLVTRYDEGSGRNRQRGVEILTDEGRAIRVPFNDEERIAIVQRRIEEAIALAKDGLHVEDDALLFERGTLPVRDWIAKLRAIGEGATAQLRVAPIMPERLWRVALDPVAPPPARVAAAVALSSTLDEEGRTRLSEAAKTTAAPRLRVALEHVARGASDDEIEEAIASLEQ